MKENLGKRIDSLEKRLEKIEKTIFGTKSTRTPSKKSFSGLLGGINLLLENNFFKKPRLVTEIQDELQKENYFHSIQSTDTALRRSFVKSKKLLTRIKVDGIWQYVLRK